MVGGVSGGTEQASRLRAVRWEKPKGGKAPAAQSRGSFSRTTNTAPKNYDCDENDCAPFAPGSPTRPTGVRARFQSEAAAGVPFAAATPKRQAPVWPLRGEVVTMRGRNTMRFSAPTREPPGGRPSRGAKLKGRGCTRQRDARNENRLGGTGAAKKAPSEQGATKAAGLGAADARLEPRQWSAAERVSRDRRRKRRCCARPLMKAKAHGACGAQHFVFINARYSLAHTKAGARSGDAGNTDFPLGFLLGGLCGGMCRYLRFSRFLRYAY